jgi:hypothetical protein
VSVSATATARTTSTAVTESDGDICRSKAAHASAAPGATVGDRHVLRDPPGDAAGVAQLIESAREAGQLAHAIR